MIEITRNSQNIDKNNEDEEKKRNIQFDKSLPFEILYKPVKVTLKEKELLKLNKDYMNILTLSYIKEDESKDEFVIGNLDNIDIEDGKNSLHEFINNINKIIKNTYNETNESNIRDSVIYILNRLSDELEKVYRIKYTKEGYDLLYGTDKLKMNYKGKKTLEVINDGTFDNLKFYNEQYKENAFEGEKKYELADNEEVEFVEELKNNVNNEREIYLSNESNEIKIKKRYLEAITTDEKIKEFFENNIDILEYYTELCKKDKNFEEAFNNFQSGKTNVSSQAAAKIISRTVFNYLKKMIQDDPIGLKNINLPSKSKENNNLAIS